LTSATHPAEHTATRFDPLDDSLFAFWPEPDEVVAPFIKEMDDWFGTPAWALQQNKL